MQIKTFGKLKKLPLGSIHAEGWLKEQMERNRDGMGGHMDELEHDMLWGPYTEHTGCKRWREDLRAGWGAELSGHYWYGVILLAFGLNDEWLKKKAENWVNAVLAAQRPDGYIGAYTENDNQMDDFHAWGTGCGMKAMLAYYEATGREDVFDAVYKTMLWFCKNWDGKNKTRYAGINLTETMSYVYMLTGDERLMTWINDYVEFLNRNDLYLISRNAYLSDDIIYASEHAAGYCSKLCDYAAIYKAGGDKLNLQAAENGMKKAAAKVLHRTGALSCYAEYLAPIASYTEIEYCTITYWQAAMIHLAEATGDPKYLDYVERVTFNAAQGARKKDEKAIAYLSSPNQIFANKNSSYATPGMHVYTPCYPTACCPVNSVIQMPDFLRSAALAGEDGLYLSAYMPATIRYEGYTLKEETRYPFRDTVEFTFCAEKAVETTLHFRIPGWCKNPEFTVNGETVGCTAKAGEYFALSRLWQDGDNVTLRLPMQVDISRVDDGDMSGRYPMAIEYGPLVFSLPIPEIWKETESNSYTELPEGWGWWSVSPVFPEDPHGDGYEREGLKKFNIAWNRAMDENLKPEDVKIEFCDGGYVWENPQIKLRLPGYRALFAYPPYMKKTIDTYYAPIDVHEELEMELVPYGCTNLRITYIPRAKLPIVPAPCKRWKE